MEPRQLLRALMSRHGDTPTSLANQLQHEKARQPQIHKFANGIVREPRRAMMLPIAEHYGVPVDAFYDFDIAAQVASRLGLDRSGTASEGGQKQRATAVAPVTPLARRAWPFKKVSLERFLALSSEARSEIDTHLEFLVGQQESKGLPTDQSTAKVR